MRTIEPEGSDSTELPTIPLRGSMVDSSREPATGTYTVSIRQYPSRDGLGVLRSRRVALLVRGDRAHEALVGLAPGIPGRLGVGGVEALGDGRPVLSGHYGAPHRIDLEFLRELGQVLDEVPERPGTGDVADKRRDERPCRVDVGGRFGGRRPVHDGVRVR